MCACLVVEHQCLWLEAPLLVNQAKYLGWYICGVEVTFQFFLLYGLLDDQLTSLVICGEFGVRHILVIIL